MCLVPRSEIRDRSLFRRHVHTHFAAEFLNIIIPFQSFDKLSTCEFFLYMYLVSSKETHTRISLERYKTKKYIILLGRLLLIRKTVNKRIRIQVCRAGRRPVPVLWIRAA